jgi:copper chaperone CopZ
MSTVTRRFVTTGLHCPSCSALIEMEVAAIAGVESVRSDHRTAITEVTYDAALVRPQQIVEAVTAAGYGAEPLED